MILGFHYHIPFSLNGNQEYVPAHFGLFIDELAKHVDQLILFLFYRKDFNPAFFDFRINSSNVKIIKLTEEKPAYIKYFFAKDIVAKRSQELILCNKILLRGPSPMNFAFCDYFKKDDICNLVVGDYGAGIKFIKQPMYRLIPVKILNYLMHTSYIKSLKGTKVAFNSEILFEKYSSLAESATVINTGNIRSEDIQFLSRKDLKNKKIIKLIYVGRIDWAKGFKEMIESLSILNRHNCQRFELHIVGWDETKGEAVLNSIRNYILDLEIGEYIFFHGKKKPGKELYAYYKMADIFVLPSYQEGFPRTIWEAFANGLPVITTPVGSIPCKLQDKKNVLFCEVKNANSMAEKIDLLLNDNKLCQTIIKNGYELVQENTIESQTVKLMNFINGEI